MSIVCPGMMVIIDKKKKKKKRATAKTFTDKALSLSLKL